MQRSTRLVIVALALLALGVARSPAIILAQPTPAQSLIGQRVTACKADVRFTFTVVQADWTATVVDRDAPAGAMWVVAVTDITNGGPRLDYAEGLVQVRDDRGRVAPWQLFNGDDLYVETELAGQYGVMAPWEGIDRDVTMRTVLIFAVAADARSLILIPADLACNDMGAPAAAPQSATPAATLIGQSVTACKGELRVRFDVVAAAWRTSVVDRPARAGAMWVVAIADVTNLGPFTDSVQGLTKVRDDRGREVRWRLFNGLDIYVEDSIAAEYRLRPSWDVFTPGITERTVLLFEVAGDARTLTLLPDNLGCGG